jgi:hypothetical protein
VRAPADNGMDQMAAIEVHQVVMILRRAAMTFECR